MPREDVLSARGKITMQPDENRELKQSSFTLITFKRSMSYGKVYLGIGIVLTVGILVLFSFLGKNVRNATYLISVIPMIIPVFAVVGSMGALMIFVSDKVKGVYEYLITYGVNTTSIFWSIVVSSIGLAGLILAITLTIGVDKVGHFARRVVRGNPQALVSLARTRPRRSTSIELFKPRGLLSKMCL